MLFGDILDITTVKVAILDFFAKGSIDDCNQTIGKFLLKIGLKMLFGDILDII